MPSSTTVRITKKTHAALRDLAKQRQVPIGELVGQIVTEVQRRELFERTNAAYAALRSDPEAWEQELAERAAWDSTLADGLEP